MQNKDIAILAARYADDKKAENIKLIDLNGLSSLCEYILIATVTSKPHLEAVEDAISTQLKKIGVYKSNRDGGESMTWRVADYGSFLVHIMTQEARDFYALDKIFSFGSEVNFKKPKAVKKTTAKKTAVKKTTAKKTTAKKTSVKKVAAKKTTAAKTTAKKAVKTTKKSTAKKAVKTTKKTTKKAAK
ncbi:MAG: ribosome silencing factor [Elusimicrobiaceae bacterium]|nr:ribosome silencing factor [Elusimicrobiaceae bacterium]